MYPKQTSQEVILVIPDLHAPFEHQDTVPFLKWAKEKFKPSKIVCLGDEADFHGLSDYDHDSEGFSPGEELIETIKHLQPIYKLFPNVMVCTSNHTARPYRKAFKHGLPRAFLKGYKEFLEAPKGWNWADSWEIDGIIFEHGEGFSGPLGALKAAEGNMAPTVIGHLHSNAGVLFNANPKHLYWGMNAGCLIDRDAYAFAYGSKMKKKPILGIGIVNKGIPMFVPMILDANGRWIKK